MLFRMIGTLLIHGDGLLWRQESQWLDGPLFKEKNDSVHMATFRVFIRNTVMDDTTSSTSSTALPEHSKNGSVEQGH